MNIGSKTSDRAVKFSKLKSIVKKSSQLLLKFGHSLWNFSKSYFVQFLVAIGGLLILKIINTDSNAAGVTHVTNILIKLYIGLIAILIIFFIGVFIYHIREKLFKVLISDSPSERVNKYLLDNKENKLYRIMAFVVVVSLIFHVLFNKTSLHTAVFAAISYVIIIIYMSMFLQYTLSATKYEISEGTYHPLNLNKFLKFATKKDTVFWVTYVFITYYYIFTFSDLQIAKGMGLILFITVYIIPALWILIYYVYAIIKIPLKKSERKKLTSLEINSINITSQQISSQLIYYIKNTEQNESFFLYSLNVENLFPEDCSEFSLYIENAYAPISYTEPESSNNLLKQKQILLLLNLDYNKRENIVPLKINVFYKCNKKQKYYSRYYHIIVCFTTYHGSIIPSQKYLYDYKQTKRHGGYDKQALFSRGSEISREEIKEKVLLACTNVFVNSDLKKTDQLTKEIVDSRKVYAHIQAYGSGKTTYDIQSVILNEKIPIVISPWESNYDHDILLLLFDSVRKATNIKSFQNDMWLYKQTFILSLLTFFNIILAVLGIKVYKVIENISSQVVNASKFEQIENFSAESLSIVILILGILIFYYLSGMIWDRVIPEFLILKKNNTQIYKDFYVEQIVSMLKRKSNYILLIEDIDRLESNAINELFRILSSINSIQPKVGRVHTLLSFSDINLQNAFENSAISYNDLINKVASETWGEEHDPIQSMLEYSILNIEVAAMYLGIPKIQSQLVYTKDIKNKLCESKNDDFNFRNLYSVCNKFKQEIKIYKAENQFVNTHIGILEQEFIRLIGIEVEKISQLKMCNEKSLSVEKAN